MANKSVPSIIEPAGRTDTLTYHDLQLDIDSLRVTWQEDEKATLFTGEILYGLREKYRRPESQRGKSGCNLAVTFKSIYQQVGIPERTVFERIAAYEEFKGWRKKETPSSVPLPKKQFAIIYADPPWQYDFSLSDSRAIENHYPTMPLEEICALRVGDIATSDGVLFLWATSPKLTEALEVIGKWGFNYRTNAIWFKPQIGMGYYFRQQHEILLVATKGKTEPPTPAERPGSVLKADRQEHSEKPEEFYEVIEKMYPDQSKIELFARKVRKGWESWGNQV